MFEDRVVMIVSGPGGAGKGTVVSMLMENDSKLWLSRSWTTRQRRQGERVDAYNFVDEDTFTEGVESGKFLEWVDFLDYRVGTPIPDPPDYVDVVLEVDVKGAITLKRMIPHAILVFITVPDLRDLETRMTARGESEATIQARLKQAELEIATVAEIPDYKDNILVNDDPLNVVAQMEKFIALDREQRLSLDNERLNLNNV